MSRETAPAPPEAWYDDNARTFFEQTVDLDLGHAYAAFLPRLPRGGAILDAGCGSGRDARRFLELGYRVEAFDASAEMVRLAREHTGLPVRQLTFAQFDSPPAFDGVFANACLLHVAPDELPGVLARLAGALKPEGTLFASFKQGQGERFKDGRLYVALRSEDDVRRAVDSGTGLGVLKLWTTADTRPGREDERWLHLLAERENTTDE